MKKGGLIAVIVIMAAVIVAGLFFMASRAKAQAANNNLADQLAGMFKKPAPYTPVSYPGGNPFGSGNTSNPYAQIAKSQENAAWITAGGQFLAGLTKGVFGLFDDDKENPVTRGYFADSDTGKSTNWWDGPDSGNVYMPDSGNNDWNWWDASDSGSMDLRDTGTSIVDIFEGSDSGGWDVLETGTK